GGAEADVHDASIAVAPSCLHKLRAGRGAEVDDGCRLALSRKCFSRAPACEQHDRELAHNQSAAHGRSLIRLLQATRRPIASRTSTAIASARGRRSTLLSSNHMAISPESSRRGTQHPETLPRRRSRFLHPVAHWWRR